MLAKKLLAELTEDFYQLPRKAAGHFDIQSYLGTPRPVLLITTPVKSQFARDWSKRHPDITLPDLLFIVNHLFQATTYDERTFAPMLLSRYRKHKQELAPYLLDEWLDHLSGWAEIDNLCQGYITGPEILTKWSVWSDLLNHLNQSKQISKQRASLVLLCKPLDTSPDKRLLKVALRNVERLKDKQEVLITKAISWVLRQMVKHHSETLREYLSQNADTLPKIAVREATRKLETGHK